jgi:hypothetical protein
MRRARLILVLICVLQPRTPLAAQWQLSGEAGAARLRQAGIRESNALTLGGTLDGLGQRGAFRSSILAARAEPERWTAQALAVGSFVGPTAAAARWQLDGTLSTFSQTNEHSTSSGELAARARIGTAARGLAFGAGAGATMHADDWSPLSRIQGDAWWSIKAERLIVNIAQTRTRAFFADSSKIETASYTVTYTDVAAGWRHEDGGLSLGLNAGLRNRRGRFTARSNWQTLDAAAWFTPRAAIVLSAGTTLDDVVRGVPRTRFLSVSLRFASQPHASVFEHRASVAGPRVSVEHLDGQMQRLDVAAAEAKSTVELMADFTDWSPVALERVGAVWRLERPISAGAHRLAIRIDGGEWIVPKNLPHVEDELGGPAVGIITIP